MSHTTANCPSCGAPVTVPLVERGADGVPVLPIDPGAHDLDLKNVGKVADLPPDPSPIQLLTEGTYKGKRFQVIGRIIYEYEQGGWNEWHIVFSDGTSGWLSDAQLAIRGFVPGDRRAAAARGASEIFRGKQLQLSADTTSKSPP